MRRWPFILIGLTVVLAVWMLAFRGGNGTTSSMATPTATRHIPQAFSSQPALSAAATNPPVGQSATRIAAPVQGNITAIEPASTPAPTATSRPTINPKPEQASALEHKPEKTERPDPKPITLYVATEGFAGLNLRSEPDPAAQVLLTMPYRAAVTAMGQPVKGGDGTDWYKVQYRSTRGYALASMLSKQRPQPEPEPPVTLYVSTDGFVGANLRAQPNTESRIVTVVPYGASVEAGAKPINGGDGLEWYSAEYQSRTGYISATLLSKRKPPLKPTPTPTPVAVEARAPEPTPTSTQGSEEVRAPEPTPTTVPAQESFETQEPPLVSATQPPGLPVRLAIDTGRVRVDAPVEYVGLTPDGAMGTPDGWWNVAWYRLGPRPGEPGNAVLAGHLDSTAGPAVFWDLERLNPGDIVSVIDDRGQTIHFRVTRTQVYYTDDAPLNEIFGPAQGSHLNLITCDGSFDPAAGVYDRRLVVFTDRIGG